MMKIPVSSQGCFFNRTEERDINFSTIYIFGSQGRDTKFPLRNPKTAPPNYVFKTRAADENSIMSVKKREGETEPCEGGKLRKTFGCRFERSRIHRT